MRNHTVIKITLLLATVLLVYSCDSSKKNSGIVNNGNSPLKGKENFDKQAHRGGRGLMPENTIPAMLNALALNVTTLEMDVVITKDKQVLLSHEPFFSQELTTLPSGKYIDGATEEKYNIYKMPYVATTKYDVGLKPVERFPQQQKIAAIKPLLRNVFAAVKTHMLTAKRPMPFFNIETKITSEGDGIFNPAPAEFCELLMKEIVSAGMQEQVIIQSFDFRTLQYFHAKYPQIKTAVLIEANDRRSMRKQLDDLGFTPNIYSPAQEITTENLIMECHKRKMQIIPWTVNEKQAIAKFIGMGVDGIITDYPNFF